MLSSFFVQFNFAKKVVRVPCSGGGDINGNLIGLIGVQMLVVGLHAGIFFFFFWSVVCVFVHLSRKHWERKWRLVKRRGQSRSGRTVSSEQAHPSLSGAEQEPGGGPAEGPHLPSVLGQDIWGAQTVSFNSFQTNKHQIFFPLHTHHFSSCYFMWSTVTLTCSRVFTTWVSTGHPESRRMLYPWCWLSREFPSSADTSENTPAIEVNKTSGKLSIIPQKTCLQRISNAGKLLII